MIDESDIVAPTDPHAPIWRYMDFVSFAAMLNSGALYLARANRLNDSHEGSLPLANVKGRPDYMAETIAIALRHWPPGTTAEEILEKGREFDRTGPQRIGINCWHMNPIESFGMWKLYGGNGPAIAIQSSYAKLRHQLPPEEVRIGRVTYLDYETEGFPPLSIFSNFVHKRRAFSYEQELRAMCLQEDRALGTTFRVDLSELIQEVRLGPGAPDWYAELVRGLIDKYACSVPLRPSYLDSPPRF